jgi:hypothetical protein
VQFGLNILAMNSSSHFVDTDIAVFCFDLGNVETINYFVTEDCSERIPGAYIILCGCKSDIRSEAFDPRPQYSKTIPFKSYIEVSTRTYDGIDNLFDQFATIMYGRKYTFGT